MSGPDQGTITAEVRAFLYSCIDSVEQLDILLAMRRSVRLMTTREVAAQLGLSEGVTRADLDSLTARGLLEARVGTETGYRFKPKSDALARYAASVAAACAAERHAVVALVVRDRSSAAKRFAHAFKLRKTE